MTRLQTRHPAMVVKAEIDIGRHCYNAGLPVRNLTMGAEALLTLVRVVAEKHETLAAANGQNFNLFAILGRETDEVHTHSAILAELLDPKGSHRQGPVFARLFAKRFDIPAEGIESARVRSELTIDRESRIDIVMTIGDMCIVVENKIRAGDRRWQLQRYHAHAKKWDSHKVIYLTLHGDDPSEDSLGCLQREEVVSVFYESDVLGWLDDCIKEVARVPQIREILAHYQALLRKLTGKSTGELVMDLRELLAHKQGEIYNFELAPKIAEAMTAFSVETEWRFWQALKGSLEKVGQRPWRLTALAAPEAASIPIKEVDEQIIRHAHGAGNKNKWGYGWTFRVESDADTERYRDDGVEVLLRVECDDWGWGSYGFIAVERTSDGVRRLSRGENERGLFDEWGERLSKLEDGRRTNKESWLAWGYPSTDLSLQKTNWLAPEALRRFVEDEAVSPLVEDGRRGGIGKAYPLIGMALGLPSVTLA